MFVALIPELTAVIMSVKGLKETRYPHFRYMFYTWLSLTIGSVLIAIGYLTLNTTVYRVGVLANIPLLFSITLLTDTISTEKLDRKKLFWITIVSTLFIVFSFDEKSVEINESTLGERGPALSGSFLIIATIVFLTAGLFWLYYMFKVHMNAPKNIKKESWINLVGALFAGPGAALVFSTGLVWILPGTDYIFIGLGALLCTFSFYNQPKLGYVLPFNVYRLLVMNVRTGIPIYDYTWEERGLADTILFSGALHSICSILNESLQKGEVKTIEFDNGVLIIENHSNIPVSAVLITSKASPILKHGLKKFADTFINKFDKTIKNEAFTDVSQYQKADEIVISTFPFVVSRKNSIKEKQKRGSELLMNGKQN